MIPTVVIVGADKGGVGKTTVTRLLLDFYKANGITFRAFDTEYPSGALQRFFPEKAVIVDITKSDDQMKVFDEIEAAQVTIVDVRAGLLTPTLTLLKEVGYFEAAQEGKMRIVVVHVLGPSTQSLGEVAGIVTALNGARHVPIANHINDTAFEAPAGALVISKLDEAACKAVDAVALPFAEYTKSQGSFILRGKVRHWEGLAFEQFAKAKLNSVN
jgi:hypothetical protein